MCRPWSGSLDDGRRRCRRPIERYQLALNEIKEDDPSPCRRSSFTEKTQISHILKSSRARTG